VQTDVTGKTPIESQKLRNDLAAEAWGKATQRDMIRSEYAPAQPFVQGARVETRQKDWNALREAIRGRADHEEIERLWDRCERWI
jgi:hypothetical protein